MKRDTMVQLIAGVLALVFLAGSGVVATRISASVGRNKLGYATRAVDGDPPQVALGIAMGAFRGVFVNYLWIRANELQEAGRYHEAVNLAKAITTLQPRFPKAWQFHAWNMAYNISVKTQTPEERWRWVNKGVRLLREQGVVYNPNDLNIHRELAWIFLHKIAGMSDDANQYYKRRFALEWTVVLGTPPMADAISATREEASEKFAAWLETIADAPAVDDLVDSDATVADLVKQLDGLGVTLDERLLERYEFHSAVERSPLRGVLVGGFGEARRAFHALLTDPRYKDAWEPLIRAVRRRVVTKNYNMDLRRMIRYTRKYGPLDWRHPAAHAVYWAAKGVEAAYARVNEENKGDFDFVNADRVVIQAVQELYRSGEIYFDPLQFWIGDEKESSFYLALPDVQFVDTYGEIVAEVRKHAGIYENLKKRQWTLNTAGYENFLKDAIRLFYRRGQMDKAEQYYEKLGTLPEQNLNDAARPWDYSKPLDEFIRDQFEDERFRTHYVASSEVYGALYGAFAALAADNGDLFRSQRTYAINFHREYYKRQGVRTNVTGAGGRMDPFPRDWDELEGGAFAVFVGSLDLETAEATYGRAPLSLQQASYDLLAARYGEVLAADKEAGGRGLDEAFPEPPGMDAWRERDAARKAAREHQLDLEQK